MDYEYVVFAAGLLVEILCAFSGIEEANHHAIDEAILPHRDFTTGAHQGKYMNLFTLNVDRTSC